ncbi:ATP-binding protein [Rubrivivax sp. RP6-9]|uniref:ATP-binding protein n=1 Tax=Rubrivivax sp. RP6-9 TaxID=3415750 RepID=UPI003CC6C47D
MHDQEIDALRAAIAALEGQRTTLGDTVLALATAPLRARLASLQRPAGLRHRQVTVLFADVVGSTALAQGLDAEDTLAVLNATLRRMAAVVEAHQGRVLRFTGDGVKAAFGMDEAREDDAERAVRAGLAILQAGRVQAEAATRLHGIGGLAVRVGVHTGDVALGAGVEDDNTAMGAAVNIAARMEQSAPPGGLRISHDTWSQVRGLFDAVPQPPLQLKGLDAPVQTYLVQAARDRGVAQVERGLQGLRTPLVGRQPELQRLQQTVALARQTRQLQALTLVGDAGLGKSRLLRELLAGLKDCRLLVLRSQPDGLLRPWGLLRNLLAVQCGVADTDSAALARHKVVEGLGPWFATHGARQAELIGQLSGLDFTDSVHVQGLDPRGLRDQALTALRAYLQGLAARGDTLPVLVAEDLHWADDGSLEMLQHLQAHAAELPLALVMTARPPLLARHPDWGTPEGCLALQPLAPVHGDALAHALLQRVAEVPPRLTELIVGRAEGNPYYMEELVRRLIDDGVIAIDGPRWTVQPGRLDTLRLPTTLVGLLQARLDALPPDERRAARQASVVGHVFWDDALQALDAQAPRALPALQRAAFVKTRATSDFEGTTERQFDHHLLHQVTYDTLLKAERRQGHGAAARWLAARTQGRGAEFLAMTGEHAERAGETVLAIDCFEQAGLEAQRRFANAAATAWLQRALDLLGDTQPMRRFDLLRQLEAIEDVLGLRPQQAATHQKMAAILEGHPDDERQARLWYAMALLADRGGDWDTSERLSLQAIAVAERCGAAETAALAQATVAFVQLARDTPQRAGPHIEAAVAWAARITDAQSRSTTQAKVMATSAMVSTELCRFDEARSTLLSLLQRSEALGQQRVQIRALHGLTSTAADLGHWQEVIDWGGRMRTLAHAMGDQRDLVAAQLNLGMAHAGLGEIEAALDWYTQALAIAGPIHARRHEGALLQRVGGLHRERGDPHAAQQWHTRALAVYESLGDLHAVSRATAAIALCDALLDRHVPALTAVDTLLARLGGALASLPAHETIDLRWTCCQVLAVAADARAVPLLQRLASDVRDRAAVVTGAADRERLIQAHPLYRGIVAAHAAHAAAAAPPA